MESGRSSSEFYYDHLWLKKYSWSQSDLQFENLQENKKPKILFLAQLHPTLCSPIDVTCQAPLSMGFPRQEYWSEDAISYSRGSSQPRDQTHISCVSCIGRQILYYPPPGKLTGLLASSMEASLTCSSSTSQVGEGRAARRWPSSPTALSQHRAATHSDFLPEADGGQDSLHALSTSNLPDQGLCSLVLEGPVSGLQFIPNSPVETTHPHGVSS